MVRAVDRIAITIPAGNATTIFPCNAMDLSQAIALTLTLNATTIGTDVGDSFDIKLQDTHDAGVTWNDRARMAAVLGNVAASATAPYTQRIVVHQDQFITATEHDYVPSGGSTGAVLAAGTTLNGPFPRLQRTAAGRTNGWRIVVILTGDGNSNASLIGTLTLAAQTKFVTH